MRVARGGDPSSPTVLSSCKIGVLILYKIVWASTSHPWLQSMSPREQEKPLMSGPIPRDSDFIVLGCSLDIRLLKSFPGGSRVKIRSRTPDFDSAQSL